MNDDAPTQLEAEFARLGIAPTDPAELILGDSPWLYPPEFILHVARALPDGAGAAALGRALVATRVAGADGPKPAE
jgi:hypothetical protein